MITRTSTQLLIDLHDPDKAEAWELFNRRYRPIVVNFAKRCGLQDADAHDVAQDTLAEFLRAYRAGRYDRDRGSRLRDWLKGIALNRVRDFHRKQAKSRERQAPGSDSQTYFLTSVNDFTIEFAVINGAENLTGCHPYRGTLDMYTQVCWAPHSSRTLLTVLEDGSLKSSEWTTIGSVPLETCNVVRIRYTRLDTATVRIQYWLDGDFVHTETAGTREYEDALVYFHLGTQEGTAWFDDIEVIRCAEDDMDCDCVPDAEDNCPEGYNPKQKDMDDDHIGDVCDPP